MDLCEGQGVSSQRHPWEVARGRFCARVVAQAVAGSKSVRCLDVGCGDAWFARQLLDQLPAGSTILGWDTALAGETIAQAELPPGLTLTRAAPSGTFDLMLCMDVIEHVEDDLSFLRELVQQRLKPGAVLLCTVPAWQALFSDHDVALKHFRRYSPASCARVLEAAGLRILCRGGLFHGLAMVRWLQSIHWQRARAGTQAIVRAHGIGGWNAPPLVTRLLTTLLSLEGGFSWLASRCGVDLPGLSWWALCRRP